MSTPASKPSLFLHIGSEKTGTASLHGFLGDNLEQLDRHGFSYCAGAKPYYSQSAKSHAPIVASFFAQAPEFVAPTEYVRGDRILAELEQDLRSETRNVILSSEHFSSRLVNIEEIRKVAAALHRFQVAVIFYMRPQYELFWSSYGTAVVNGRREPPDESQLRLNNAFYNYLALLYPWAQVFGAQSIILRDYHELRDRDICADFAHLVGIPDIARFKKTPRINRSLTPRSAEIIRRLNRFLPDHGEGGYLAYSAAIRLRWRIDSFVRFLQSAGAPPNLAFRQKVESLFAASNQELRETYADGLDARSSASP